MMVRTAVTAWTPLRVFSVLWAIYFLPLIIYSASGIEPSEPFRMCWCLLLGLVAAWWVERDSAHTGVWPWFEYSAFVFLAWPILLPHYLIRSRGFTGMQLTVLLYSPLLAILFAYMLAGAYMSMLDP
jgi:hypothetical protein